MPAIAQILPDGQDQRQIALEVVDGRALIAVRVADTDGVMMLDTGTPETVMFNRDAATLAPGPEVGRGNAASGQTVVVMVHDAPEMAIAGEAFPLPSKVTSGDLGFVEVGFGPQFLGFIGAPALEDTPFVLDFQRKRLAVFRQGSVDLQPSDSRGRVVFSIWPGEQPTTVAQIGDTALLVDFDTGDRGTLYASDSMRAALVAGGFLTAGAEGWVLSGLRIGGVSFDPTTVRLVKAGGPEDFRRTGASDFLRLGADFLTANLVLWDFSSHELVFLTPEAGPLTPE